MRSLLLEDRDYVYKRPQKEVLSLCLSRSMISRVGVLLCPHVLSLAFLSCKSGLITINSNNNNISQGSCEEQNERVFLEALCT